MKNDSLFRTSMVGGYNKDDVKAYIEKLEKEIERLRSVEESAGLLEKWSWDQPFPVQGPDKDRRGRGVRGSGCHALQTAGHD